MKSQRLEKKRIKKEQQSILSKMWNFVKSYWKIILSLLFVLIMAGIFIFQTAKFKVQEKTFIAEKEALNKGFEQTLDSLTIMSNKDIGRAFSWAVRAELVRGNTENVDELFNNFIQFEDVQKVMLIDPLEAKIVLSTDKKNEGKLYGNDDWKVSELTVASDSVTAQIINPIMSLDKVLGVIIIDFRNN